MNSKEKGYRGVALILRFGALASIGYAVLGKFYGRFPDIQPTSDFWFWTTVAVWCILTIRLYFIKEKKAE